MPLLSLDARQLTLLRRRLLHWFDHHQRDLPWRKNRDPYRIWLSEVMLQQTTVATVAPRFDQFLTTFPTVSALAAAEEHQVLRLWEGLGYYRRARDLHRAARMVVDRHGSHWPDNPQFWAKLPGVGRYILGAVLSQAFDCRLPIVEANSQRVLCRLFGQAGDPSAGPVKRWLWQTAESLLPRKRVGDFNQAMMELGALVCTPAKPRCDECPLRLVCIARKKGLQDVIPTKTAAPKIQQISEVAVVVRNGSKVLLVQRPASGRWANMWEFPHLELNPNETHDQAAKRLMNGDLGIEADLGAELLTIRHAVTRYRITMVCLEARYRAGLSTKSVYPATRWLEPAALDAYPVSTPQRKLVNEIARASRQLRLF